MELETFTKHFVSIFEVTPESKFSKNTDFKALDEWDSLMALEAIILIDEEYEVELDGDDILNARTIEDLFKIVKNRTND